MEELRTGLEKQVDAMWEQRKAAEQLKEENLKQLRIQRTRARQDGHGAGERA